MGIEQYLPNPLEWVGIQESEDERRGVKKAPGILGSIVDTAEKWGLKMPPFLKKALGVEKESKKERAGLFSNVMEGLLIRQFPTLSKWKDVGEMVGLIERGPEGHPLQHEIENITALSMFVPDAWLKNLTDPLAESQAFQTLISYYDTIFWASGVTALKIPYIQNPDTLLERVKKGEPDAVIDFLRVVNQDIASGAVTLEKIGIT
ncbi:hypothetical protein GF376_02880 [Candidatus Peregrinibacteria bacterium]|nr:hypothetical protein [Candidatus Peregrinibacteria bacterium]